MPNRRAERPRGPVAVFAPSGRDAAVIGDVLSRAGVIARTVQDMPAFAAAVGHFAEAGIIAEEALAPGAVPVLASALHALPTWSDPPIIVLGAPGRETPARLIEALGPIANIVLIERPTHPVTLLAAVRAALLARARQHATRAHLDELDKARQELANHSENLAAAVERRTQELEAASRALRLAERMATIGTLAAGVGHDLANLLMPIRAHADALKDLDGPAAVSAAAIRACVEHLSRLAAGLRQLALDPENSDGDGGAGQSVGIDLAEWWATAEPVLRNALPRGMTLSNNLDPAAGRPRLTAHQLTQAVFNLVQNAGDAMRSRGHGSVTVWARPGPDAATVSVGVTDDGPGMTPEVQARCLDPLFTTKTRQLSTGLGLVVVTGVVRRAGGRLEIESELGKGSTFRMIFPVVVATKSTPPRTAVVAIREPRHRAIAAATLDSLGFDVRPADTGNGATPSTDLWLVEASGATPEGVRSFIAANPARRVVFLGARPAALKDSSAIIEVPEDVAPSELRRVLGALRPQEIRPGA